MRVYVGDCLAVLRTMPDASIDAIVTDPPYGLSEHKPALVAKAVTAWTSGDREHVPDIKGGFMSKAWDSFVPPPAVWDECLRVLKPGGHMLVFAGTRTVDLMGLSIRLAGFEMRDAITWMYGSGFPKSLDVSKAIDKAAGAEREVVGIHHRHGGGSTSSGSMSGDLGTASELPLTAPATDAAKQWQGWGTALKPASEPIIVARKPLSGTVAATVLEHGTGALNIDATRVSPPCPACDARASEQLLPRGSSLGTHADADGPDLDDVPCTPSAPSAYSNGDTAPGRESWTLPHTSSTVAPRSSDAQHGPRTDPPASARSHDRTRLSPQDSPDDCPTSPRFGDGHAPRGGASVRGVSPLQPDAHGCPDPRDTSERTPSLTRSTACPKHTAQHVESSGRWPTNVVLVHSPSCDQACAEGCPVAEMDQQSGPVHTQSSASRNGGSKPSWSPASVERKKAKRAAPEYGDVLGQGASRFFPTFRYQAKAPTKERPKVDVDGKQIGWPTVKPLELMRWLVRLVTPPGGVVLDPFAGTGTTGQAAQLEGFTGVLIERDEFAVRLIRERLAGVELEVVEPVVQLDPTPPTLFDLIAQADGDDEFSALFEAHEDEWTDEHTAMVKQRLGIAA